MATIHFEDRLVKIVEDRQLGESTFDVVNETIVEKKTADITTTSDIYVYPDGYMLYLSFDHSGLDEIVYPTLSVAGQPFAKKLIGVPLSTNLTVKRYGERHFLISGEDKQNEEGYTIFLFIDDKFNIKKSRLNYSKIIDKFFIEDKYVVINCIEKISADFNINTIALYNLKGVQIDLVCDEKRPVNEYVYTRVLKNKEQEYEVYVYTSTAYSKERKLILTHKLNFE